MTHLSDKNQTGYKGIRKIRSLYVVSIYRKGVKSYIGSFKTLDAAIDAYSEAYAKYPPMFKCNGYKDKKIKSKKANPHSTIREYTSMSDTLIVTLMNEDGMTVEDISSFTKRDEDDLRSYIDEMKQSGRFDKIHNRLMRENGVYAVKMKKQSKRGQIA